MGGCELGIALVLMENEPFMTVSRRHDRRAQPNASGDNYQQHNFHCMELSLNSSGKPDAGFCPVRASIEWFDAPLLPLNMEAYRLAAVSSQWGSELLLTYY